MSTVRRTGNFGIADLGHHGYATFSIGRIDEEFGDYSSVFSRPTNWYENKMRVGGYNIVPLGYNNAMPQELQTMLDQFYAGERHFGKNTGFAVGRGTKTLQGNIYRHRRDLQALDRGQRNNGLSAKY